MLRQPGTHMYPQSLHPPTIHTNPSKDTNPLLPTNIKAQQTPCCPSAPPPPPLPLPPSSQHRVCFRVRVRSIVFPHSLYLRPPTTVNKEAHHHHQEHQLHFSFYATAHRRARVPTCIRNHSPQASTCVILSKDTPVYIPTTCLLPS